VIKRAYKAADVSGNGFVGRQEFGRFLKYLEFFNTNWSKFEQIEGNVQLSGRLTLSEFKRASAKLGLYLETNAAGVTASGSKSFAGKSVSTADAPDAAMAFQAMRSLTKDRILMVEFCSWVARKRCPADDEWMDTTKYAHMKPKQVYKLGMMYKTGEGVEKDLVEAHVCFKSAAARGSVSGKLLLHDPRLNLAKPNQPDRNVCCELAVANLPLQHVSLFRGPPIQYQRSIVVLSCLHGCPVPPAVRVLDD
jgi:hypothetical protein